jgi:Zn-dependent membrane protease YugP
VGIVIVVLAVVLALAFLPQMWVRKVIASHAHERADIPGSGGELARHLLDGMGLGQVKVEETTLGDHYDPEVKAVRLSKANFSGRSLSAIVIAAHEVGHAMQDASGYAPLSARTRLAKQAARVETIGAVVMLAAPLMVLVVKSPALFMVEILAGMLILSFSILIHAVTLPVEYDASFRRALPLLASGGYVQQRDMPSARRILRAAALTYVAAAAISLLDVMRWIRMLRF